jgi:hypothetical protein
MKYSEVNAAMHDWFSLFEENNERGFNALSFISGESQASVLANSIPESNHIIINLARKFLEKEKGDVLDFELCLRVHNQRVGMHPNQREQVELVLKDIILKSHHLIAFQDVLQDVYEFGYGVVSVMPYLSQDDLRRHISVGRLPRPNRCFFDPFSRDPNYTTGKFCGIKYDSPQQDKSAHHKRNDGDCLVNNDEVVDVFYREKVKESVYIDSDGVVWDEKPFLLIKKRNKSLFGDKKTVWRDKIFFHRFINGESASPKLFVGNRKNLPFVFWRGNTMRTARVSSSNEYAVPQTIPFCSNLEFTQNTFNIVASELMNQVSRSSRDDIFMIPDQFISSQVGSGGVSEVLRKGGVLNLAYSQSDNTQKIMPQLERSTPIDANILNTFQMLRETLFFLGGQPMGGEQGTVGSSTTGEATKQKRKTASFYKKAVMENHLRNINKVGEILIEAIPYVYNDFRVFYFGSKRVSINSYNEETLFSMLKKLKVEIVYAYSSESDKENNLDVISKLISVLPADDIQSRKLYNIIAAENLHGSVADIAKRMMEIDIDSDTLKFAKGLLTKGELERRLSEKAAAQQQPPDPTQQKLEIEKMKATTDASYKQGKLQLEEEKAKAQLMKDQQDAALKQEKLVTPIKENIVVSRSPKTSAPKESSADGYPT